MTEDEIKSINRPELILGIHNIETENLKVLRQQALNSYNEAERIILAINKELEQRGNK